MTVLWTATEAAKTTGGRVVAEWGAYGVSIDSRTVVAGDLFVALRGPNHDGHDFAAAALARGAAAAVVARIPNGVTPERLLVVEDTRNALDALACQARARSAARVVAVTGSVGKTGTKEMLKGVLARQGLTHATQGNLNNHWGVPLTLARMPAASVFVVLEMGMNHAGELAILSRLARPDVAVITAVEPAHLEFFTSVTAIADAKAEIFTGMDWGGIAILNRDNPYFDRLARHALSTGITRIYGFGGYPDAEFRLCNCTIVDGGTMVEANVLEQAVAYRLGMYGYHWALNSLAVIAAVEAVGGRIGLAIDDLATVHPPAGRGSHERLKLRQGSIAIIDESYNASPAAMIAALAVLGAMQPGPDGRRIAVLGDMLELGTASIALHTSLAKPILDYRIDLVFTTGSLMAYLHEALPPAQRGGHATSAALLVTQVTDAVRSGDVVLVKGSAGSQTSLIVTTLRQLAGNIPATNIHCVHNPCRTRG